MAVHYYCVATLLNGRRLSYRCDTPDDANQFGYDHQNEFIDGDFKVVESRDGDPSEFNQQDRVERVNEGAPIQEVMRPSRHKYTNKLQRFLNT